MGGTSPYFSQSHAGYDTSHHHKVLVTLCLISITKYKLILKLNQHLTRYAAQAVHRFAKQDMAVYDSFVTGFLSNSFQALNEALESGTSALKEDHYLGLVRLHDMHFVLYFLML